MSANRPNMLFIMSDDHASHAIGSYGSRINRTPNIDRIAEGGMRFDNCFCTNSICTPSRAVILTGKYSHKNGVKTLKDKFDNSQTHVAQLLRDAGYQTAIVGKWHLGRGDAHNPSGFDYWNVLPGQGKYHNPPFIELGEEVQYEGYVTDLITDLSLDWLKRRDKERPFMLMVHHKAPHRHWEPDEKHAHMYEDIDIPEPETFHDDYANRSSAADEAAMRVERDLNELDLKVAQPEGLTPGERKSWNYQRYIKDYLRCIASVDDNVGRMLDYLDDEGLARDTIVVYTSDQGFFLGDHGWYDKRFMYEESLRMPFLIRYPAGIRPGTVQKQMALNVDFAETLLDYAGEPIPHDMQGASLRPLFEEKTPEQWQSSVYYRYWEHLSKPHRVGSHYGVRTDRYKLIYYYGQGLGASGASEEERAPEWELFDLERDAFEMNSVYDRPEYAGGVADMTRELERLRERVEDFE